MAFFPGVGGAIFEGFGNLVSGIVGRAIPIGLQVGEQFASGLLTRELNRSSKNDLEDAIKAQLRAAANAVSPTAAPGQTPVYSGGPATGSAFMPATLLPPSIQPPNRILETNPNFFPRTSVAAFQSARRPPDLFTGDRLVFEGGFPTTNVGLGSALAGSLGRIVGGIKSFGPTGARRMAGLAGAGVAVETGAAVAGQFLFPSTASAPGLQGGFPSSGDPLQITDAQIRRSERMPAVFPQVPTGLPARGNFQREANGAQVQWYFWDGNGQPQPIDRGQAECLKRDCIFRLNVFTGKFVKLKGRRMNPMNVRAFFRAGRRVDAGERICRKMFSEHRKTKTGTVRRKRSRKAKR